ncbi:hypothetical protein Sjap_004884 [Stephania japonica]|uniref:AP2/ERF domain-containing protein n=1 Tax=Stephania japonica TaxID=461633 RepID=A0AAP0K398_9MAGN
MAGHIRDAGDGCCAHDVAELCLKGANAVLNFPDLVSSFPTPASTSAADIRDAAVAAAEAMRPATIVHDHKTSGTSYYNCQDYMGGNSGLGCYGDDFVDEEVLFDAPNFLVNMAEGMLLSPPRIDSALSDCHDLPREYYGGSLWS